ncbi:MAG: methyltransferase domain-containing protein [Gammaproteobacteria bacterium]
MTSKLALTRHIAELYARGENMLQNLRSLRSDESTGADPVEPRNSVEDIMISYDFQAGSYIEGYRRDPAYLERYTEELAKILTALGPCATLLEAGCGEATTLAVLAGKIPQPVALAGFDISWSRVRLGRDFAGQRGQRPTLFCADLFRIPLADHSVDVVYTSHSIEPNGGRERDAVAELARVARRWLVLLEPAHELAGEEARRRMESHGYVRGLPAAIRNLGLELVEHRRFPVCANPLNPTGLYLVRIDAAAVPAGQFSFRCPVSGAPLLAGAHAYYAPQSFLAYPVLDGIPCLLESNAILATQYQMSSSNGDSL